MHVARTARSTTCHHLTVRSLFSVCNSVHVCCRLLAASCIVRPQAPAPFASGAQQYG